MSRNQRFSRAHNVRQWGRMLRRARNLTRTLGTRVAAGYLRNKGLDFSDAYLALFNRMPRIA